MAFACKNRKILLHKGFLYSKKSRFFAPSFKKGTFNN